MKKKLLLTILAVICAITCTFAFTACNDDESTDDKTNTEQGDGKTDGKTDDKSDGKDNQKTDGLTAEKWAQAFDSVADNCNFTATSKTSDTESVSKLDGDKIEMYVKSSGIEQLQKFEKADGTYYMYMDMGGTMRKVTMPESSYTMTQDSLKSSITFLKDKRDKFTYANGVYTATNLKYTTQTPYGEIEQTYETVKVTVENGAITKIEYKAAAEGVAANGVSVIDHIGTTVIELPTEYEGI